MVLSFELEPVPRVLLRGKRNRIIDVFPVAMGKRTLLKFYVHKGKCLKTEETISVTVEYSSGFNLEHLIMFKIDCADEEGRLISPDFSETEYAVTDPLLDKIFLDKYEVILPKGSSKVVEYDEEGEWYKSDFN